MTSEFSRYRAVTLLQHIGNFNFQKKRLSENSGKMKIKSRLYLNYPQACFSNDIVTRFDLMRISVDLGNKQHQVGKVDKCKRKSKTIMEITMLTSLSITRPCVCIGTACIAQIKNYTNKCNYLQYLIDLICTNMIATIASDQSRSSQTITFADSDALAIHTYSSPLTR